MQAIGLRNRFFLISFTVLLFTAAITFWMHSYFSKKEKLMLIDQQVRTTAFTLLASELAELKKIDIKQVEKIISDELGETRIGKFFTLRNNKGVAVYQSFSAQLLPLGDIPQDPQWITIENQTSFIRILNLKLPSIPDRTLQVGVVVDPKFLQLDYFSENSFIFFMAILSFGLLLALILSSVLLRPISQLSKEVSDVANLALSNPILPSISKMLNMNFTDKIYKDEFIHLIQGLDHMIHKINRGNLLSKQWSQQMAHELKTPLAIMNVEIEREMHDDKMPKKLSQSLKNELNKITETINSFLSWAELENSNNEKKLHAVKIEKIMANILERFEAKYPKRLKLVSNNHFYVFTNQTQLEQFLSNIILNALNYSPVDKEVEVIIGDNTIEIKDQGDGIPQDVLDKLGEPFNRGHNRSSSDGKSHGLGLAWVYSLAKKNNWKMKVVSNQNGTLFSVQFPAS